MMADMNHNMTPNHRFLKPWMATVFAVIALVVGIFAGLALGERASALSPEEAKAACLAHAGLDEADASAMDCHLDWENGQRVYEVEFNAGTYQYDYHIHAATGQVLKYARALDPSHAVQAVTPADGVYLSEGQVQALAFAHAQVDADAVSLQTCHLDWEDGVAVYELSFYAGGFAYDYEIAAASGTLCKVEQAVWEGGSLPAPQRTPAPAPSAAPALIGEQAAKSAAFTHAGVAEGDVTGLTCHLDWEDGQQVYEIDFYAGGYEYDYHIHATTGAVVKGEREWDD